MLLSHVDEVMAHPLLQFFLSLNLPADDCLLFGSTPMAFHGLKALDNSDLDILVKGTSCEAWRRACYHGRAETPPSGQGLFIRTFVSPGGFVEIFSEWWPSSFTTAQLFERTTRLPNGLQVASLLHVLDYKILLRKHQVYRDKDIADIEAIRTFLNQ